MAVCSFGGLRNDFSIDSNVLRQAHEVPEMTEAPSRKVVSDGASGFVLGYFSIAFASCKYELTTAMFSVSSTSMIMSLFMLLS